MPKNMTDAELAECKKNVDERVDTVIRMLRNADAHELQIYYTDNVWRPMMYGFHQALTASGSPNTKAGEPVTDESQLEAEAVVQVTVTFLATMILEMNTRMCDPGEHPADFAANLVGITEQIMVNLQAAIDAGPMDLRDVPGAH